MDVWQEVDRAERAWASLHAQGRELHFELGEGGGVAITLRDLDGEVLRAVSPSEAVSIASDARP